MVKYIIRCGVTPIKGFRELIYGCENKILGFWVLGNGITIFTDSIEEYSNSIKKKR